MLKALSVVVISFKECKAGASPWTCCCYQDLNIKVQTGNAKTPPEESYMFMKGNYLVVL